VPVGADDQPPPELALVPVDAADPDAYDLAARVDQRDRGLAQEQVDDGRRRRGPAQQRVEPLPAQVDARDTWSGGGAERN
jgi:hypothetical protein